jgi:hypothetical protein
MPPRIYLAFVMVSVFALDVRAAELPMAERPADAPGGSEFAKRIAEMGFRERERLAFAEVQRGNVPLFWRKFVEVKVEAGGNRAMYRVSPDYVPIGSDEDYFLMPLSPLTAQAIADALGCVLPTRKMVDDIYRNAEVKLAPENIPPSAAMTTAPVFAQHNESVRARRAAEVPKHPLGALVAGHKKDVVLTPSLAKAPGKVAIYGWHRPDGRPIQPLYAGHTANWVDYSHGIRLVAREMEVNGAVTKVESVLADGALSPLLSDEGAFPLPRYAAPVAELKPAPGEVIEKLTFEPGVRVVINQPAALDREREKPVRLILYALPNGNTIEQTIGHRTMPGEDWHYDIQHIGAQTRWLRERLPDVHVAVAYLECSERSWPAWRKKHDPEDKRIAEMVGALRERFSGRRLGLVLTGHSGGGSFTFGYLNGIEEIPSDIERIAFLDSNYAYDSAKGHDAKLARWLASSAQPRLCVMAYHDNIALLNGKTFVSEKGGSWGRSLAMQKDLATHFEFTAQPDAEWQRYFAGDGRIQFLLRENPAKAILHTRIVEWNGFIHAMLTGTPLENRGYTYFGPRAYDRWLAD